MSRLSDVLILCQLISKILFLLFSRRMPVLDVGHRHAVSLTEQLLRSPGIDHAVDREGRPLVDVILLFLFQLDLFRLLLGLQVLGIFLLELCAFLLSLLVGHVLQLRGYLFTLYFLDVLFKTVVLADVLKILHHLLGLLVIGHELVGETVLAGHEFA